MSAAAITWTMVLMLTLIYAFSVTIALRIVTVKQGHYSEELHGYFGDVPRTALTLLSSILSGLSWHDPTQLLFEEVGWVSGVAFLVYVTMGVFILVNIVAGIFLDKWLRSSQEEEDRNVADDLAAAFGIQHGSEDAEITWQKFKENLLEPGMPEFFHSISIDMEHAREIFELLDSDHNGTLSSAEVVAGCLKLRGPSRSIDIAIMMQNQKRVNSFLIGQIKSIGTRIGKLQRKERLAPDASAGSSPSRQSSGRAERTHLCL